MRILGIETSGRTSSVAVVEDETVVGERVFASRQVICEVLAGEILNVLDTATVQQADLDGIAVSIGPGSFTGLRVGVTMAKAVAYACQVPAVGISTPEAWATEVNALPDSVVAVIQPARVDYVYLTTFRTSDSSDLIQQSPPQLVDIEMAGLRLGEMSESQRLYLTGDAIGQLSPDCCRKGILAPKSVRTEMSLLQGTETEQIAKVPRASTIALLAAPRLVGADAQSCFTLRPNYIAVSQAERSQGLDLGL